MAVIVAWAVTFTVVAFIILALGFGPIGVGASAISLPAGTNLDLTAYLLNILSDTLGTLAAAFQSYMYGGFTPAGGIFATLTSMAMLGTMMPLALLVASSIATVVASIVWICEVGR